MTYVIHGATGAQGAPVVAALAAAGKPVTALTRNAGTVVDGARVLAVDYSSTADLTAAYRGTEGVFIHLPVAPEEDRLAYARTTVAAIREARPARVVFSTSGGIVSTDGDSRRDDPAESAVSVLAAGLADSGVSHAVIEPRFYLENLLLPHVITGVREEGVLRYPLPSGFRASWASHLDIADAATALFERTDVTGVVSVGQYPAISGEELAEAFTTRLGRTVTYEATDPDVFFAPLAAVLGEQAAAATADMYRALGTQPDRSITAERSAQKRLGVTPRTASQWLADIDL
ncbi:NmrA family NAD(P)-binding protein [Streptomyces sp. NBC_00481]|uniref:NmrA family NAD(P)-binding protein n=1 Tax=Streptomyces sp. NBC_00481 TaxID=2975755 RepID=UPI002DD94995|nr:NmrA family NAD(P)-binding protein [Streptomyces sp. NBC_00481]WRZ00303.1 NmrA family NAD(P)-binding protein [Streptomyces sp. NBC_00481]